MAQKNYIGGNIKKIETKGGGSFFSLSLKLDDLASCNISDKGYIRLNLSRRKEPLMYDGKITSTHYLVENNWQPKESNSSPIQNTQEDELTLEDIPF